MMVAGGWIEGMYVAIQIANSTNNDVIINKIVEEKVTLENLISLLESYKNETDGVQDILTDLIGVKMIYDSAPDKFTIEHFKQLSDKITEIRTKIIQ